MAANIFTGAISFDSNVAGNWSQGTVPVAGDGHVTTWDASSPKMLLKANMTCNEFDATDYADADGFVADGGNTITVSGNITLGASMNEDGNILLNSNTSGLIFTTNGYYWKGKIILNCSCTLADDITVNKMGNGRSNVYIWAGAVTINIKESFEHHHTLTIEGDLIFNGSNGEFWGDDISSASLTVNSFTINTAGIFTFSQLVSISIKTQFVYTAGTMVFNTRLQMTGVSSITTGGGTFGDITLIGSGATFTINGTLNCDRIVLGGNNSFYLVFSIINSKIFYQSLLATNYTRQMSSGGIINVSESMLFPNCNLYNGNTLKSSTVGNPFYVNLGVNAYCDISGWRFWDMDASGGKEVKVLRSQELLRCTNVTNYDTFYFEDELSIESDTRDQVEYGDLRGNIFIGSCKIPAKSDTRYLVPVDDGVGSCRVPTAEETKKGVPVDDTVGTYEPDPVIVKEYKDNLPVDVEVEAGAEVLLEISNEVIELEIY